MVYVNYSEVPTKKILISLINAGSAINQIDG